MSFKENFKECISTAVWSLREYRSFDHLYEGEKLALVVAETYVKVQAIFIHSLVNDGVGKYAYLRKYFFMNLRDFGIKPIYAFTEDYWYDVNSFHVEFETLIDRVPDIYCEICELCADLGLTHNLDIVYIQDQILAAKYQREEARRRSAVYADQYDGLDDSDLPF